jgi:hypothetical protein
MPAVAELPATTDTTQPNGTTARIRPCDVNAMAKLVAKRLTEVEACGVLGIKIQAWKNWKMRVGKDLAFEDLLARVRGKQLEAHLRNIEDAERGKGAHERADWRASAHLLKVKSPERFGDQQASPVQVTVNSVSADEVIRLLGKAYASGQANGQASVGDRPALGQLPSTATAAIQDAVVVPLIDDYQV